MNIVYLSTNLGLLGFLSSVSWNFHPRNHAHILLDLYLSIPLFVVNDTWKMVFENISQLFIANVQQGWHIFSVKTHIINTLLAAGHIPELLLLFLPLFYNPLKI